MAKGNLLGRLRYAFGSGKNSKLKYYFVSYWRLWMEPRALYRRRLEGVLRRASHRPDFAELEARAEYYCPAAPGSKKLSPSAVKIKDLRITRQKVYFFDSIRYLRWFDPELRVKLLPGDVNFEPEDFSVAKARLAGNPATNVALLNLNRVRHFFFVRDRLGWEEKENRAVFIGEVRNKPDRIRFMDMYFGSPFVDCGIVDRRFDPHPEWIRPKMRVADHLRYRYILCLEGHDVASNLKWVMSSNSLAVMPRPTCETWFMEGTLQPGVHYVEVRPDFSDLKEKMDYYDAHPQESRRILEAAHRHVARFRDPRREKIVSLLTLRRHFSASGQGGSR